MNKYLNTIVNFLSSLRGVPKKSVSQITKNVFLGGRIGSDGLSYLSNWGVTGIVNMRTKNTKLDFSKYNIDYIHLPVKDGMAPTLEQLEKGVNFINKQMNNGGKVYIHCRWGRGRGPTMTATYLINTGMTVTESLQQIYKKRNFISLSKKQMDILMAYEKKHLL